MSSAQTFRRSVPYDPLEKATAERILSIRRWTEKLFSVRATRNSTFRFTSGQWVRLGIASGSGLPGSVIERAKVVLAKLEQEDRAAPKGFEDLPLFAANYQPPAAAAEPAHDVVAAIAALNPDEMSPREAMEALYKLKAKLRETEKK